MISPSSPVNSHSVIASNVLASQYKTKKSLSAAKACIPQILPSKFKPKLSSSTDESQERRTEPTQRPKAHSCEDLQEKACGSRNGYKTDNDHRLNPPSKGNCSPESRNLHKNGPVLGSLRSTAEFSALYRNMHNIQRPSSLGSSSHGSVRGLASYFEKPGDDAITERIEIIPRAAVTYQIMEFERIIQRSSFAPTRSASMPILPSSPSPSHSPPPTCFLQSAVSAETLVMPGPAHADDCPAMAAENYEEPSVPPERTVKNEENHISRTDSVLENEIKREERTSDAAKDNSPSDTSEPTGHHHHHDHFPHHLKQNKCKGTCPASYTRFTTILRHERQQATTQHEKRCSPPKNLLLMGPAPFSLRRSIHSQQAKKTLSAMKPMAGDLTENRIFSPKPKPVIPQRLSSLEVLERLSNGEVSPCEGCNSDDLTDVECSEASKDHAEGGYAECHECSILHAHFWA